MPRGKSDSPTEVLKPEVTTIALSVTRPPCTRSSSRSRGSPTSGRTTPAAPAGITWAPTPIDASVISVTSAVPPVTFETLPARPPSVGLESSEAAAITGWSSSTPSLEPLSILMLEYQTFGERAITRAVTGSVPCGKPSSLCRPTSPFSCSASRCAVRVRASSERSSSTSRSSAAFLSLASTVSPTQPNRSRTGLSARLAPVSIGAKVSWAPRWRAWKKPPPDSPK